MCLMEFWSDHRTLSLRAFLGKSYPSYTFLYNICIYIHPNINIPYRFQENPGKILIAKFGISRQSFFEIVSVLIHPDKKTSNIPSAKLNNIMLLRLNGTFDFTNRYIYFLK